MKILITTFTILIVSGCSRDSGSGGETFFSLTFESLASSAEIPEQRSFPAEVTGTEVTAEMAEDCDVPGAETRVASCAIDEDGDGVVQKYDCNDADPEVFPLATDIRCDGKDQNCNGFDECDRDGDGHYDVHDCDPDDAAVGCECFSWCTPLPTMDWTMI